MEDEHRSVNKRRSRIAKEDKDLAAHWSKLGRGKVKPFAGFSTKESQGNPTGGASEPVYDTIGLALSGGGIRSAAFLDGELKPDVRLTARAASLSSSGKSGTKERPASSRSRQSGQAKSQPVN